MAGLFAFLFLFLSTSVIAQAQQSFCAQTFNVYGPAYASQVQNRLNRLAVELTKDRCDFIQLQELWRESHYLPFRNELEKENYGLVRADELRGDKSIIGLTSVIDGEVRNRQSSIFLVNNLDGIMDGIRNAAGVQKGYTFIEAATDQSPFVTLINLHTHPDNEAIRLAQVTQLVKDLLASPHFLRNPIVLSADLNATPTATEVPLLMSLLVLRDSYLEANSSYGNICTYCANNPLSWSRENRVIDYVLVGNSLDHKLKTLTSQINLKGPTPRDPLSDHYGVRSQISFETQGESEYGDTHPIYKERMIRAVESIEKALKPLSKETGLGFREAAQLLKTWRDEFKAGRPNPEFDRIFRTPGPAPKFRAIRFFEDGKTWGFQ